MWISSRRLEDIYRQLKTLQDQLEWHEENFQQLNKNGMATIVNKLQQEVLVDTKESDLVPHYANIFGDIDIKEPSLRGKVEAIVGYLGLDFSVNEKKAQPSGVVAIKRKVTKKKGRK